MINRQRSLLRLLVNESGRTTKTRLFKLAFVLSESSEAVSRSNFYEFLPYNYGPYSFTLNHELRSMERDGWLRITDSGVELLQDSSIETNKIDPGFLKQIDSVSRRYQKVSTPNLVSSVYKSFPWYTALAKDQSLRSLQLPQGECAIFTVGYEGLMVEGLLDLLLRSGVRSLIDVRCNAVARRFGFHRSTLERHCLDVGIKYRHLPELGIPSDLRANLNDLNSYNSLFEHYEEKILPSQTDAIEVASCLIKQEPSALMCMEANAACCHRSRLARAIAKATKLEVKELREP